MKKKIENLNLDSELLKPMKEKLEHSIDILTKNAILTEKDAEITLKINVKVEKKDREFNDQKEEYLQPFSNIRKNKRSKRIL